MVELWRIRHINLTLQTFNIFILRNINTMIILPGNDFLEISALVSGVEVRIFDTEPPDTQFLSSGPRMLGETNN